MHLFTLLRSAVVALALGAASVFAQEAKLTADSTTLAAQGGELRLTATTSYPQTPGALGWSVVLPAGWTLVAVSGPNTPDIAPPSGATGTLEFAHATAPASGATFVLIVSYPAGAPAAKVTSTALVRIQGQLHKLTPSPVGFSAGEPKR